MYDPYQKWDRAFVLREIIRLYDSGVEINCSSLSKAGYDKLISAANRYYGNWSEATKSAGIRNLHHRWTKSEILESLREFAKTSIVNYSSLRTQNQALMLVANRHFGSWENAAQSAGVDFHRINIRWTPENIIEIMQHQNKSGLVMNCGAVRSRDCRLFHGAKRIFKSWDNALIAAGIDVAKNQRKWNKKKILERIQLLKANGQPINCKAVVKLEESLYQAGVRHFGSWDKTLINAHVELSDVKKTSFWTPDLVIKRLKQRHSNGKKNYQSTLLNEDSSLLAMSKKYFGSLKKSLEAAGLEYKIKSPCLFGEKILGLMLKSFFPDLYIEHNYRNFPWLKYKRRMELDYYIPSLKLAFEFQGPNHFLDTWGQKKLNDTQLKDKLKQQLCSKNGIILLQIKYNELHPKYVNQRLINIDIEHKFNNDTNYLCDKYVSVYRGSTAN